MDDVWTLIEQMLKPEVQERSSREQQARSVVISRLFASYRDMDEAAGKHYVIATADIPLPFLVLTVVALERSRVYPKLPTPGELWEIARKAAGMDRQQYHAGQYLPPPREWPPDGQRHAITKGEFELLPGDPAKLLPAGALKALGEGQREIEAGTA